MNEAINAINNAGGNLVKDGELELKTITESMDGLLAYIKDAENKVESNLEFPFGVGNYEYRKDHLDKFNRKPIFMGLKKKTDK